MLKRTKMNQSPTLWRDKTRKVKPRRRFYGGPTPKAHKPAGKPKPSKPKTKTKNDKEPPPVVTAEINAHVDLTPAEKAALSTQLTQDLDQIDLLKEQAKTTAQDFKLRITNVENNTKAIRLKLNSGGETRPVKVRVEFDVKRQKKQFFHFVTGDFIREDDMTGADNELPMFREDGEPAKHAPSKPVVPPKTADEMILDAAQDVDNEEKLKGHFARIRSTFPSTFKGTEKQAWNLFLSEVRDIANKAPLEGGAEEAGQGKTSLANALDKAAAGAKCAPVEMDLSKDMTSSGLIGGFRLAAKKAGWNAAQIKVLVDAMKERPTVEEMKQTLTPHIKADPSTDAPPL